MDSLISERTVAPGPIDGSQGPPSEYARIPTEPVSPRTQRGVLQILVATDFSRSAAKAVRLAADFALRFNAKLTLLHVVDTNPPAASGHAGSAATLMSSLWSRAVGQMSQLMGELADQGVQAETAILEGLPWEQIAMQSGGYDLLVLGKASKSGRWNFFSRHTSRRVMRAVSCPVLTA